MDLSPHFTLAEFTRSETAARMGIANKPGLAELRNLYRNAAGMEEVRGLLGGPIHVQSGLRCEELERVLCAVDFPAWCKRRGRLADAKDWADYFQHKRHPRGLATDFVCPSFGTPAEICRAIAASTIGFDRLILEHDWVHIDWPVEGAPAPRELLTLMPGGNYAQGIVEKEIA